jgi:hypothetical protein
MSGGDLSGARRLPLGVPVNALATRPNPTQSGVACRKEIKVMPYDGDQGPSNSHWQERHRFTCLRTTEHTHPFHVSIHLAVANLSIEAFGVKMSRSSSPERPVFITHPLYPPHLRNAVEEAVDSFDSSYLLPPQEGEAFHTAKDCLRRLQRV